MGDTVRFEEGSIAFLTKHPSGGSNLVACGHVNDPDCKLFCMVYDNPLNLRGQQISGEGVKEDVVVEGFIVCKDCFGKMIPNGDSVKVVFELGSVLVWMGWQSAAGNRSIN